MFRNAPIIETQYFPVLPFFALGIHCGSLTLEANENYQKGGFRNKTAIITSNGIHYLSVPLTKGKHQQTPIKEVKIEWSENWSRIHWNSIKTAYGKAPYFLHYEALVFGIFRQPPPYLYDFNWSIIEFIIQTLQLPIKIQETQAFALPNRVKNDFRNVFKSQPKTSNAWTPLPYPQVFQDRFEFVANPGILDLLFCLGPESISYLMKYAAQNKTLMEAS